jgi:hypothetical protein
MGKFTVGVNVSRKVYTDVVVRVEAETLDEAKLKARLGLDKMFNEKYCEEKVNAFFNKVSFEKENWWEDMSFEAWDVIYSSGEDYSESEPHVDLTVKD